MKPKSIITLWPINWLLFFVGIWMVWDSTHNRVAMVGAILASLHFTIKTDKEL